MGQHEILSFLKEQRELSDKWFAPQMIKNELRRRHGSSCNNVHNQCIQLGRLGVIEWVFSHDWRQHSRVYRYKVK